MASVTLGRISRSSNPTVSILLKKKLHSNYEVPVKEVQIKTDWGHIAGKLWGSQDQRPMLALHGWQDNAGTWDTLAPILAKGRPILAVDFPGHGLSSWHPQGMSYFPWGFLTTIAHIKEYYGWDKISLLAHSMGSIASARFSCIFPDDVDIFVGVENLIGDEFNVQMLLKRFQQNFKAIQMLKTFRGKEPPSYTYEDIIKIWHEGTQKSVAMESVPYLLKRGSKPSKLDPNKFYFSRDPMLKYMLFSPEDKKFVETIFSNLKCPTLNIKAIDSNFASHSDAVELRESLAKNNPNFQYVLVPGTHHIHLNTPENVSEIIISFLKKHNQYNEDLIAHNVT